jgi:hypothetical protein
LIDKHERTGILGFRRNNASETIRLFMDSEVKKQITERLTVSVAVAAEAFGIRQNAAYAAVKAGQIPSIRIGGKIAIPTVPLRRMLQMDDGLVCSEAAE